MNFQDSVLFDRWNIWLNCPVDVSRIVSDSEVALRMPDEVCALYNFLRNCLHNCLRDCLHSCQCVEHWYATRWRVSQSIVNLPSMKVNIASKYYTKSDGHGVQIQMNILHNAAIIFGAQTNMKLTVTRIRTTFYQLYISRGAKYINTASATIISHGSQKCYV